MRDNAFSFSYYIIKIDFLYVHSSFPLFSFHHKLICIIETPTQVVIKGSTIDQWILGFFDRDFKAADFDELFQWPQKFLIGSNLTMSDVSNESLVKLALWK